VLLGGPCLLKAFPPLDNDDGDDAEGCTAWTVLVMAIKKKISTFTMNPTLKLMSYPECSN